MTKRAILAAVPFLMAHGAFAEATDAGAQHLTEVFQTYLGTTEGVVSVAVNGDSYDLTLNATPLIALGESAGVAGGVSNIELSLTDNGDGTWAVSQDQSVTVDFSIADALVLSEDIGKVTLEGTFDESIMTFSEAKGEISGVKIHETITEPGQPPVDVDISFDSGSYEITGKPGAAGGVDSVTTFSLKGFSEVFNLPPMGEGQPPMPVTIKAESLTETVSGTGVTMDGFYKLAAFFVAHPDPDAIEGAKAELKTVLTGALPLWANINGSGTVSNISVETPIGPVAIAELGFLIDMNGVVADGKFREGFTLSGVTLPPGVLPDWAAPILPQKLSLDVQVTDFDAAAAATVALGALDMPEGGMVDDSAMEAQLLAALLPKGTVTITLNPGAVTGDGYELTYEGAMVAGPQMPMPTGTAKVTLTGLDTLNAALANAPDDIKGQVMMGVGMAQGMAKQDGDKLVWEIDASTPGSLSVNGVPMMGGQ